MVADDIRDRFDTENIMEDELPRQGGILKSLASMLTMKNTLAVYRDFYEKIGKKELFVMADKKTLEWADVYPFLYLHAALRRAGSPDIWLLMRCRTIRRSSTLP